MIIICILTLLRFTKRMQDGKSTYILYQLQGGFFDLLLLTTQSSLLVDIKHSLTSFYIDIIRILTGGYRGGNEIYDDILTFNGETNKWNKIGSMTVPRERHAIQLLHDVEKYCPSNCPSGWERFQDHCYLFVRSVRNWEGARQYCRSYQVL